MKYQTPTDDEAVDLLDDKEFAAYENDPKGAVRAGRRKAWRQHRATGVMGQLRDLACSDLGASVLLSGYKRTGQISVLTAQISLDEGVQLSSRVERSLVDGSIVGVRVTLAGFTR